MTLILENNGHPYLLGILMSLKADKPKAPGLPAVIRHDPDTHGIS